ncbi:metallophosphoesterase [Streptomyces sp. NPDC018031]|uniref:metallophosphoesterase n=1 Tax=Streptomyces sp. NPDC018031 TaxID=3365033 RepID=UPI00378EBB54
MVAVFVLIAVAVLGLLAVVHWYLWRRLVRDTTAPGGRARRVGTWAAFALPVISVAALVSGRAGAPFTLQRVLAWPGYLWLAMVLYLTLALLVGEAVRPLLLRWLVRRDRRRGTAPQPPDPADSPARGAERADRRTVAAVPVGAERAGHPADGPAGTPGVHGPAPAAAVGREAAAGRGRTADTAPATGGTPDHREHTAAAAAGPVATADDTDALGDTAATDDTAAADATAATDGADTGPESGRPALADPAGERIGASAPAGPSRRLFVARTVAAGAGVVAASTVGYGMYTVLSGPRLKRVTVPLAKLPRAAHGYKIAVVSDIHLGPILGRAHTQRIVDTINRAEPDLVAVVGDLVDGSVADLGPAAEPLRGLRARHGSYFVTGNHEYFSGAEEWVAHVRELGLHPLENARRELPWFDLAGVNDISGEDDGQGPDYERALGDRDPARASVLLAHQPVVIHDAVEYGVDLQLSGHSHGGQMWPGNHIAALANPTVAGLERYGDTQLYVTRGAGAWGPPVRVGAPSDITLIRLAATRA